MGKLMNDLLKYDPSQRPTCEEILQYPYFSVGCSLSSASRNRTPITRSRRNSSVRSRTLSHPERSVSDSKNSNNLFNDLLAEANICADQVDSKVIKPPPRGQHHQKVKARTHNPPMNKNNYHQHNNNSNNSINNQNHNHNHHHHNHNHNHHKIKPNHEGAKPPHKRKHGKNKHVPNVKRRQRRNTDRSESPFDLLFKKSHSIGSNQNNQSKSNDSYQSSMSTHGMSYSRNTSNDSCYNNIVPTHQRNGGALKNHLSNHNQIQVTRRNYYTKQHSNEIKKPTRS